jgi:hypothetical protein
VPDALPDAVPDAVPDAEEVPTLATIAAPDEPDEGMSAAADLPTLAHAPDATLATEAAPDFGIEEKKKKAGFPFARLAKYAAALLVFAGVAYAAAVYMPPAVREGMRNIAERRERRDYSAALADSQKAAESLASAVAAASTPDAFKPLPAAFSAAQGAWVTRTADFSRDVRDENREFQISNLLVQTVAAYSNALDRQAQTLVTECMAAFQRGDSDSAEKQADAWQGWRDVLSVAAAESQADQITSARGEFLKGVEREKQAKLDEERARRNEAMPVRFEVSGDIARDPSFARNYDAGGKWLLATDSLKLPPGPARFRFTRADYEPIIRDAVVESQKPLSVSCPDEWVPTTEHTRLLGLRAALAKLRAADATKADLDAAVKWIDGPAPVLADAARKGEWDGAVAEVKQTLADYRVADEAKRIADAFVKELHALAADPARLASSTLGFPDGDILARADVRDAAARLVAAATNRVVAALSDEPLDTRADRLAAAEALLSARSLARVVGIAGGAAPQAAVGATRRALDAAGKAVFVRVRNRTDGELRIGHGGPGVGQRDAKVGGGGSTVVKVEKPGAVRIEAALGEDYQAAVKTVEAVNPGVYEAVFAQDDFKAKPGSVALSAGDARDVEVALTDGAGRTVATKAGTVQVAPGAYTARFARRGYAAQERDVTVVPGKAVAVAPDAWKHEMGELVLSLGDAADAGVRLVADGREVAVKPGRNVVDTGRYTLTFARPGAVEQTETFVLAAGGAVEKRPAAWQPLPACLDALRAWAFEKARAGIQAAAGGGRAPEPPGVPDWIVRAQPAAAMLGNETNKLNKLQEIYVVMCDAPSQPLTMDKVADWERLLAAGYVPNACDATLVRQALAVWEAHCKTIQEAGAAPQKTKEAALQAVERVRRLHAEIVRKTEEKKTNENRYAQGNKE